jgi:hypothetical protein
MKLGKHLIVEGNLIVEVDGRQYETSAVSIKAPNGAKYISEISFISNSEYCRFNESEIKIIEKGEM